MQSTLSFKIKVQGTIHNTKSGEQREAQTPKKEIHIRSCKAIIYLQNATGVNFSHARETKM